MGRSPQLSGKKTCRSTYVCCIFGFKVHLQVLKEAMPSSLQLKNTRANLRVITVAVLRHARVLWVDGVCS